MELLIEINKAVRLPAEDERLSPKDCKDAIPAIAKFYALTFFFLGEFMDWYVRKGTCRSLKNRCLDIYSQFHTVICSIKGTTCDMDIVRMDVEYGRYGKMMKQAHLWEEARLSQVGLKGYERRLAAQNAMVHHLIWDIQQDAAQRVRLKTEKEIYLWQMLNSASCRLRAGPGGAFTEQTGACLMTKAVPGLGM